MNSSVLVEMCMLNEYFSILEAKLFVTKQVNTLLTSRLISIEQQCWLDTQYSRRECPNIIGISRKQILWRSKWQPFLRSWDVISRLNALKFTIGSVKGIPQSLTSFREGRTASRFGVLRETCEK